MNNWRISGSVAMRHWWSDSPLPKDIDLLTKASFKSSNLSECFVDASWHDCAEYILQINEDKVFLDKDILFTLKVSHANWDIKWDKTMHHINFMMHKKCKVNEELYKKLIITWNNIHGKKQVNLNKTVEDFFNNYVKREIDHEKLHELIMFNDRPLHEKIRPNLNNAFVSKELFYNLDKEQQLEVMMEEALVIAIERFGALKDKNNSTQMIAISKSLKQLITSMTSGWFAREFILNRDEILHKRKEKWKTQLLKMS